MTIASAMRYRESINERIYTYIVYRESSMRCRVQYRNRKRHLGEPGHTRTHGTHGTHGRTRAHGSHGRTSQPSTQSQRHTRTKTATDSTAARTAASPESTAPRGRLRRGRPQRTRPCLHPLPERLSPRLLEGGRRNEGARGKCLGRCVTAGGAPLVWHQVCAWASR